MGVLLGGLLEAWLVGPIYGANVVLFVMLFYLLTLRGSRGSKRSLPLLLVVGLLSVTTTAQAFTLLADIIVGFVKAPDATTYFTNEGRMAKFLTLIFYLINSEICDLVMTWRVYVLWERNAFILASFILMDFVTFGSGIVGIVELRHAHVFNVHSVHTWTTVTWACSVAIQVTGTLLIAWRAWSTPKTIPAHRTAERYPWAWALLWLLVDSGVLFSFTTLLLLALAFTKPMAFDVMTSALGQIAALVSLSIALRECWKAEHEREQTYVARSLLSDRLPQTSGRPGSRGRDGGMMTTMVVAIQTSQHQRADGDQIFIKEPSHHNLKTKETTDSLASV